MEVWAPGGQILQLPREAGSLALFWFQSPGSLYVHIFAYSGPFWGVIYIPQSNVQIGSVWLDGF